MNCNATYHSYKSTGAFSKIVTDYLEEAPLLKEYYQFSPNLEGIKQSIKQRRSFNTNRESLVAELRKQYASVKVSSKTIGNITSLLSENTFTICTAHQPNIFTGHLYFIYKIIHAIKLADTLNESIPDCHFVPVYYMGSEDADLKELGEVSINGEKYTWETSQKGSVGRMKVDKGFISLIELINGHISVEPFGKEIGTILKEVYSMGKTIEQATFELVHLLFSSYGLLVLLPDNPSFKKQLNEIHAREMTEQFSHKILSETVATFPEEYKMKATGRAINLFYLKDDMRERMEEVNDQFVVSNTSIVFSKEALLKEIKEYPERFSPNVVLRPVYQEFILPNVAFIGGGGELAYWLELKNIFKVSEVPFPVLILRNSFTIVPKKVLAQIDKLLFKSFDFFMSADELKNILVKRESGLVLDLNKQKDAIRSSYSDMRSIANAVDITLSKHIDALEEKALKKIEVLEGKILKAEKKKYDAQIRQIQKVKHSLFPEGSLQERVDNMLPFYAKWGIDFIEQLYKHSNSIEASYCIIEEN